MRQEVFKIIFFNHIFYSVQKSGYYLCTPDDYTYIIVLIKDNSAAKVGVNVIWGTDLDDVDGN